MHRCLGLGAVIAACVGVAGCGYPSFQFGPGGGGGAGSAGSTGTSTSGGASTSSASASSSAATSSATSASSSTTSASSATAASSSSAAGSSSAGTCSTGSSSGAPAPCGIGHLVISDVQSSGQGGATDEFVVLYNPTESPVTIDASWSLGAMPISLTPWMYTVRWTGGGGTASIPARGHYLIVGSGYAQPTCPDDMLSDGISDEESLVLFANGAPIDAVCYYNQSDPTEYTGDLFSGLYTCAGTPVYNPQDGSASAMIEQSIARKPGYSMGSCTDTTNNVVDFIIETPSMPEDTWSRPN